MLDRESLAEGPVTAGAVFIGPYAAQAAGDYATGSNHVLPTAGAARFRGGLSAADFVRVMSVQRLTRAGLTGLAPIILPLARAEGLETPSPWKYGSGRRASGNAHEPLPETT